MTNYYLINIVNQDNDYKHSHYRTVLTSKEPEDVIVTLNKYKDSYTSQVCIVNVLKITKEKYDELCKLKDIGML